MKATSRVSARFAALTAMAAASVLVLLAAPVGAAVLRSPLTIPAVSLLDVKPNERTLLMSTTRGSASAIEYSVGIAGVHLPDGAQVTSLAAFAIDESSAENLAVRLFRRRIGTALLDGVELALVQTNGSAGVMQEPRDVSVELPTIDNSLYIYWVAARLPEQTELFGIQLEFRTPLLVDGFESADTSAWLPGGVEPGFVSPLAVSFADAMSTTLGADGCFSGGETGSTSQGFILGGWFTGAECCFIAPVHLPNGVEVTAMISYLVDSGSSNLTLSLRRKSIANQVVTIPLATTTSSGSGGSVRLFADGTIDEGLIDNDSYTYFLSSDTCLDPGQELRFYQALIFYEE